MAKPVKSKVKSSKSKSSDTGTKRTSLADLWDDTDPGEASNFIPEGQHEVRINEVVEKHDPKKGTAVIMQFEIIEGDLEGKTGRQMYKMTDADGQKGPGMAYLKRDLALLDYDDVSGKALTKTLKEISEEQPMVVINAKQNGQYMNYYLQGLVGETAAGSGDSGDVGEEIEEGDKVKWTDSEGDDHEGEVQSINKKKETAKVKDDDDDVHVVDLSDLEKADDQEAGPEGGTSDEEIEVGSIVEGENDEGDDIKGEVTKIKGDVVTVKDSDGDKHICDKDDLKIAEPDEPEEIEVGDTVKWEDEDGNDKEGEVTKIKGDKVTVKDDDDEIHKVDIDDLEKVS